MTINLDRAIDILGINRSRRHDLEPMVKALQLHDWLNTPEDEERLAAAKFVLRHWTAYTIECNRHRSMPRTARCL